MADIFDVIADGTRREILHVLRERHPDEPGAVDEGTSVSEIVAELQLSQPTVSKHLKVLREAELVTVREDGQHRFYSLKPEPLEAVEDWLIPFLSVDFSDEIQNSVLTDQARQVAGTVGKVVADTTYAVSNAVQAVTKKLRS
ncbi:ArsR/SmtB family transcription factor [Mycetocola reblochoni]|uniref:Transcriptional regulator, ArsR family n=2 Tax=Mycetocola reblochoni TaxID=331618 RepID=A0A1R4IWW6_9MICO|nr:metalloregulator ArsR/SmtB family transcription factor [Mycetocola reblochoni]RLP70942.1 ArsR family transcriptional regulator [Mycetocola reblochoni]SJN24332.1 Transcriptional regulator, ArsR family [Mycetocola reblochoni REB411]